jgi:polysaccharide deacetylase 2 family uncharacterized protein YibQ
MRRINASRPIASRRTTRRRRAIAPAVPAGYWRLPLRAQASTLVVRARATAIGLLGSGRSALGILKSIPFDVAYRRVSNQVRGAYLALCTGLSAGLSFAGRRVALGAAAFVRAVDDARRWIAGVRLPEIPGRDPVSFGAAVGAAIILGAGLVVLIGSELRKDGEDTQTVAALSDRDWDRLAGDRQPVDPAAQESSGTDNEAEVPQTARGHTDGIAEPAPVVALAPDTATAASDGALADQDENLAAALPLLDIRDDGRLRLALRPPERSPLPVRPPLRDARPPVPAARPQWLANAVQTQHRPGTNPMIAIVIDDAGVARARTERAIDLPPPLTIAFIPYSRNLTQQTRRARQNGHELLLHIPMEAGSSTVDPGPNALLTSLDGDEIMRRFRWALSRFDGYVGVNNHMGSKFMARPDLLEPLLLEMHARGLMFLDSRTDRTTVGADLARGMELPHASRQVFLDNDLDADKIAAQLAELERVARRRGHAIAIGHPHDVTVDVLAKWIPEVRARGFDLVPVSAVVKLDYGAGVGSQLAAATRGGESDGLLGGTQ